MINMKLDNDTEKKLALMLPGLKTAICKLEINGTIPEEVVMMADIHDYFLYTVDRCTDKEEAIEIIKRFSQYSVEIEKTGDEFHGAFFFVLLTLLELRLEIKLHPIEEITYDAFERSFSQNIEKFLNKK